MLSRRAEARSRPAVAGGSDRRARRLDLRSDRGEIPTVLVIFASVILVFYGALHAALVFHGQSVVAAAAEDGLRAAQIEGGTSSDGVAAAERTLGLAQGLRNKSIDVDQGSDSVRVRVTAEVQTPLIELFNTVGADVTGPRERFYSEAERR